MGVGAGAGAAVGAGVGDGVGWLHDWNAFNLTQQIRCFARRRRPSRPQLSWILMYDPSFEHAFALLSQARSRSQQNLPFLLKGALPQYLLPAAAPSNDREARITAKRCKKKQDIAKLFAGQGNEAH